MAFLPALPPVVRRLALIWEGSPTRPAHARFEFQSGHKSRSKSNGLSQAADCRRACAPAQFRLMRFCGSFITSRWTSADCQPSSFCAGNARLGYHWSTGATFEGIPATIGVGLKGSFDFVAHIAKHFQDFLVGAFCVSGVNERPVMPI
jgi:hypothetical protein